MVDDADQCRLSLLGKSMVTGDRDGISAARQIRKRSVWCIDNLKFPCTEQDVTKFMSENLSVNVLRHNHVVEEANRWRLLRATKKPSACAFMMRIDIVFWVVQSGPTQSSSPHGSSRLSKVTTRVLESMVNHSAPQPDSC